MRWTRVAAVAAAVLLAGAACGSPSKSAQNNGPSQNNDNTNQAASTALDPTAKGPAPDVPGAKKGGTVTAAVATVPNTFDPSRAYYQDVNSIERLTQRALTGLAVRNGKSVLVPDLATDLGKVSSDQLTWTFTIKDGIKYEDGTPVKAADFAYAIKRSFAHDELSGGPTYQDSYFKDGDKYKGPYKSGDNFAGVSTPDDKTLVIHLARPFSDLPFFASFPLFAPLPKAKDTKDNYGNHPLSTGPYMFDKYQPGQSLTLKKNPNWDPKTDPFRHQYVDAFDFKFAQDLVKVQTGILAGNGPDATTLNYDGVDSSLLPKVNGANKDNLVSGASPCTVFETIDTRVVPLPVRKALATAWDYDDENKAAGNNPLTQVPATTIDPPQTPGWIKFDAIGNGGKGTGDPAKAKQMLAAAGKTGFTIRWYYSNNSEIAPKIAQVRKSWLKAAGFTPLPIGVPRQQIRDAVAKVKSPANIGQGPAGWCLDWPSGSTTFPTIFDGSVISSGNSAGFLNDAHVNAENKRISGLPADKAGAEWAKLDNYIMKTLLPVIPTGYNKSSIVVGSKLSVTNDPNYGMPDFVNIYVK